jgi:hypothetical protein
MQQMAVDIQQRGAVLFGADHMVVPQFVVERKGHDVRLWPALGHGLARPANWCVPRSLPGDVRLSVQGRKLCHARRGEDT